MNTDLIDSDLTWALFSEPLIVDACLTHLITSTASVDLPRSAEALRQRIDQPLSTRVGVYFEQLIQYWLRWEARVEMIADRQQVVCEGRTIGELDFVFRDGTGALMHLETAVKFYLHFVEDGVDQWLGPNANDSFPKKVKRLFEHQLPLSKQVYDQPIERHALVKGQIFYHPSQSPPQSLPERLNSRHLQGAWVYSDQLPALIDSTNSVAFRILAKPHWLSPGNRFARREEWLHVKAFQQRVRNHFATSHRPLMVSCGTFIANEESRHRETKRAFIVSRQWP